MHRVRPALVITECPEIRISALQEMLPILRVAASPDQLRRDNDYMPSADYCTSSIDDIWMVVWTLGITDFL